MFVYVHGISIVQSVFFLEHMWNLFDLFQSVLFVQGESVWFSLYCSSGGCGVSIIESIVLDGYI